MFIPDHGSEFFFYPGSRVKKIWSGVFIPDPDPGSWFFYPSRILARSIGQKGTRTRIPDPDPDQFPPEYAGKRVDQCLVAPVTVNLSWDDFYPSTLARELRMTSACSSWSHSIWHETVSTWVRWQESWDWPVSVPHGLQSIWRETISSWVREQESWEWLAVLRIRNVYPGSEFFHPVSTSATKNWSILTQKIVSKLSEIWSGLLSRIRILIFYSSWIPDPGVKKAPNPGSATLIASAGKRVENDQGLYHMVPMNLSWDRFYLSTLARELRMIRVCNTWSLWICPETVFTWVRWQESWEWPASVHPSRRESGMGWFLPEYAG